MPTFKFDESMFRAVSFLPSSNRAFVDGCTTSDAGRMCLSQVSERAIRVAEPGARDFKAQQLKSPELAIGEYRLQLLPHIKVTHGSVTVFEEWEPDDRLVRGANRTWVDPLFADVRPAESWLNYRTIVTGKVTCSDGRVCSSFAISLRPGEPIYGLGEHFGHINKRGGEFITWAADAPSTPSYATYVPVPFVWSPRGWGLLVNTYSPVYFDLGKSSYDRLLIVTRGPLDVYLMFGTPKEILGTLYDLTGLPRAPPPKWSFGYWQSKCAYNSQDEVLGVARELRARGYPADVIHVDPPWEGNWRKYRCDTVDFEWDTSAFPDPKGMVDELHRLGFKLSLWINPYIEPGTRLWSRLERYMVKSRLGGLATPAADCQRREGAGIVDLTDPEGFNAFKQALKDLVLPYADVIKADYGEAVPPEADFRNGMSGEEAHNYYPVLYMKAVYEATLEAKGYSIVWGRSGSTGVWQYPLNWGGDVPSSWEGLRQAIRGLLSYHASGALFGSFDVGGFIGRPSDELYLRFLQAGVMVSHVRAHGVTDREPWKYSPRETLAALRLRYRLLPYIYSESWRSVEERVPLVRPLPLEHPDDPNVYDIDDEFYLGSSLLVAPIVEEGQPGRRVYLPEGRWVDYFTGNEYEGGRWVTISYDSLDRFPLLVRENSVIPMLGADVDHVPEGRFSPVEFHTFKVVDAEYPYYDDGLRAAVRCRGGRCSVDGMPADVKYTFVHQS
ncbi:MAG: glycoside hydrolase family 31 protein [Acidilobus sp.]